MSSGVKWRACASSGLVASTLSDAPVFALLTSIHLTSVRFPESSVFMYGKNMSETVLFHTPFLPQDFLSLNVSTGPFPYQESCSNPAGSVSCEPTRRKLPMFAFVASTLIDTLTSPLPFTVYVVFCVAFPVSGNDIETSMTFWPLLLSVTFTPDTFALPSAFCQLRSKSL